MIIHHFIVDRYEEQLTITPAQLDTLLKAGWIQPWGINPGHWLLATHKTLVQVRELFAKEN